MTAQVCPAQTGPIWKLSGEPCGCRLPADHVGRPLNDLIDGITAREHQCPCGAWWADSVRRDSSIPTQWRPPS